MKVTMTALGVLLAWGFACAAAAAAGERRIAAPPPDRGPGLMGYHLSGPYTHDNLTVFLVHGPDRVAGREILSLQEAIRRKVVTVHETGNVNELVIVNHGDVFVFIQSGDIVKGGKQDRTIALDFICPPRSGKVPVKSFCVEEGRWRRRGGESAEQFADSAASLSSKGLKLAAAREGNQGRVWEEVRQAQRKLSTSVRADVAAAESKSSLQLSLENPRVREAADAYVRAIAPQAQRFDDVVGYAFAINGKVNSADLYGSSALFRQMWPKLLHASAVEAVSERREGERFGHVRGEDVRDFMAAAERGAAAASARRAAGRGTEVLTRETEAGVLSETRDRHDGEWLHRNYVAY